MITSTFRSQLDEAPRLVKPPLLLAKALRQNATARAGWKRLSFSHQREHADAITKAKKPDTQARRVAQCVAKLEEHAAKPRPRTER